jgi:hypothetical protein
VGGITLATAREVGAEEGHSVPYFRQGWVGGGAVYSLDQAVTYIHTCNIQEEAVMATWNCNSAALKGYKFVNARLLKASMLSSTISVFINESF